VVGRATSGAAAGAASGAAIGAAVPVVGPLVGGATGAVVGGAGGAVSGAKAKKAYKAAMRAGTGNARKVIVAEFAICAVIAALSPMTDTAKAPTSWMKRMTAIMGLFFILGLISAGGRGASRAAAGFGGIVTVALLISERDVLVKLASVFRTRDETISGRGPGPSDDDLIAAGGAIGDWDIGWNPASGGPSGESVSPPWDFGTLR